MGKGKSVFFKYLKGFISFGNSTIPPHMTEHTFQEVLSMCVRLFVLKRENRRQKGRVAAVCVGGTFVVREDCFEVTQH